MNTLLLIGGCILGYLVLGLIWARTQAVRLQGLISRGLKHREDLREKQRKNVHFTIFSWDWRKEDPWFVRCTPWSIDHGLSVGLGFHALGWPIYAIIYTFVGLLQWSAEPVNERREKVAGLRARAEQIATLCEDMPDSGDRRILRACIQENRELAEQLEL